ncbi:hypothetical protein TNCV_3802821 [Trichonephila clavipes]|nr:hypothetical protein TNCV_3802821 [Trichonephila clavipes]
MVKVSDQGWHDTSLSPVPLKTRRVGERWTLNLSRAQTSSHWCDVVIRWRYHLSPPAQFRHGTGGEGNNLQPPALVVSATTAHKTFRPTDLTSTYSD